MKSWKVENEVWFYNNIYSRKNFVVKFISRSNKFLLKRLVIKTSDKKYERRFDRSTVIFKVEFMNKNSAYIQFLKQWDEGKS